MTTRILAIIAAAIMLTSCASKEDVAIMQQHYGSANVHNTSQSQLGQAKAQAIGQLMEYDCSTDTADCGAARALAKAFGAREIASINTQEFNQPLPKTSLDVQEAVVDKLNPLEWGLAIRLSRPESQSNNQTINTENGDITTQNSMNNPAISNTAGYGNAQGGFSTSEENNTTLPEPVPE